MKTSSSIPRAAALAAALLALFAVTAAAKPLAYFKVGLKADSKLIWSEDITSSCEGSGELRTIGNGEGIARLRTTRQAVVALERDRGIGPSLSFVSGAPGLPVAGTLTRKASEEGFALVAPSPGSCPAPEPVPPDCGTRAYPPDSHVSLGYETPNDWPYPTPTPLTDVLVVSGPNSAEWAGGPPFRHCTGAGRDDLLGEQEGTGPTPPLTFPVSVHSLLARKRFTLKRRASFHLETFPQNLKGVSGTRPVEIETSVSLSFTRLPHAPRRG